MPSVDSSTQTLFNSVYYPSDYVHEVVEASHNEISSLTEKDLCSICLEGFEVENESNQSFELPSGRSVYSQTHAIHTTCRVKDHHYFHRGCLETAFQTQESVKKIFECPNCRYHFTPRLERLTPDQRVYHLEKIAEEKRWHSLERLVANLEISSVERGGTWSLALAAYNRQWKIVEAILTHLDLSVKDKDLALFYAYKFQDWEIVQRFLQMPDFSPEEKGRALVEAASMKKWDIVKGALNIPDIPSENIGNILFYATKQEQWEIAETLLSKGKLTESNCSYGTSLMLAAKKGKWDIVETLLTHLDLSVKDKDPALSYASELQEWSLVERFLQMPDFSPEEKGRALAEAASMKRWDIVKGALNIPDIPSKRIGDILFYATKQEQWEIVETLLSTENLLNANISYTLTSSAEKGKWKIVLKILEKFDVSSEDINSVLFHAKKDHMSQVIDLISMKSALDPKEAEVSVTKKTQTGNVPFNAFITAAIGLFTYALSCDCF